MDDELKTMLRSLDRSSKSIIDDVPLLQNVDFPPLLEHPADWADHTEISNDYVRMLDAAFVHYNGDVGLVLRFLGGEYTAEWRDVDKVVSAARPYISAEDCEHIYRILTKGCPLQFHWEETAENKEAYIRQGNCPSVTTHWPGVLKTLVKEVRNRHLMTFSG